MSTARYKPTWKEACDLMERALGQCARRSQVAAQRSLGRVVAQTVRAPRDFPPEDRAGMDGMAVVGARASHAVLTGEPVAAEVSQVVMDELNVPVGQQVPPTPARDHVSELGSEYRAGESICSPGDLVDAALFGQLAVLGIESVSLFEDLRVHVVVAGSQGESTAVSRWLDAHLKTRYPATVSSHIAEQVSQIPLALDGACDFLIIASDGSPGRYRQLRELHRNPPAWYRSLFWKLDLHPCKHIGFGLVGDTPALVLPDVLYKTVLSSALVMPIVLAAAFGLERPECRQMMLAQPPDVPGPYPYVWPVRRAPGEASYRALTVSHGFSGRDAVDLTGLAWWNDKGVPCRLWSLGWGRDSG